MASMSVEQLIEEIRVYIETAHTSGFGGNTIKLNRDELLVMIDELKIQLPRELNQSKEIIRNEESHIANAKAEAERILNQAAAEAEQMIDEDEIVNMAYMRAQEIVDEANEEADEILRQAQENSYNIQSGALQYTQGVLGGLEEMFQAMVEQETGYFNAVLDKLKDDHKQILDDKKQIDIQLNAGMRSGRSKEDFENKEEVEE